MSQKSRRSLKNLLIIHEIAFLFLVAVTGLLGGLSAYFWHQTSAESVRINDLIYLTEQIRGQLFRQMEEVIRARLMEDPQALEIYAEHSRHIDKNFNQLRRMSANRSEAEAIQSLQLAYREMQKDMNNIFNDPYVMNYFVRLKILDPRFANQMVGKFEENYNQFKSMLELKHQQLEQTIGRWTRIAPVVVLVVFPLALMLVIYTRYILRSGFVGPMQTVMDGASVISRGQLTHRIPEYGVEEVADIAGSINRMAQELIASRDALVESEKQAALGALVPVVAHNIRNPLASIRATAQVLDDVNNRIELNEGKQAIIDTIDRLGRWVNALVSYLHPLKPNIKSTTASEMVEAALTLLKPKLDEKQIRIVRRDWGWDMTLSADPDLMEQVLYSLLANAVDASPEAGVITIRFEQKQDHFNLTITDNGPGLPFEPKPSNLEPGPSLKRFGTGLGIPIAFKICQTHGWKLKFNVKDGSGTEVLISAPLKQVEGVSA